MLNTLHLHTFLAVVQTGNYTYAAEKLHMSQPAVSMHIRALEEQLGNVRLFRRVGQRMALTHAGEELLHGARELISLSERTEQNIRALRGHVTGRVVIGCTPSSGEHLLPLLLSVFFQHFPEVTVEVRVAPCEILLELLLTQHISVLFLEEQHQRRGWESHLLGYEDLKLLVPPDCPLLHHAQILPGMLRDYPLLLPGKGSPLRQTIEEGLRQRGIATGGLHVAIETDSISLMLYGVYQAMGLAFVPSTRIPLECTQESRDLAGAPLQQEWYAIRIRERNAPRAIEELYQFLIGPNGLALFHRYGLQKRQESKEESHE